MEEKELMDEAPMYDDLEEYLDALYFLADTEVIA